MIRERGRLRLATCIRLGDSNAYNHLRPLADHPDVESLYVIRHAPVRGSTGRRMKLVPVPTRPLVYRLIRMFVVCRRLVERGSVDALVFFNPLPYALLGIAAAGRRSIPYHLGFIGTDWHGRYGSRSWLWKLLRGMVERADFVTVPGGRMRDSMIDQDIAGDPEKVRVLPHAIDLDRFSPPQDESHRFDFVFVGALMRGKRVDLILKAFARVRASNPEIRLCIVGDGPLRERLKAAARELSLGESVEFAGYTDSVEVYLRQSRVLVMASEREGFPYVIAEAMSCGLVPVSTNVGAISETLEDGINGFLVECGDWEGLADRMKELIDDRQLYSAMRKAALETRERFSYTEAVRVWDEWIGRLSERAKSDT